MTCACISYFILSYSRTSTFIFAHIYIHRNRFLDPFCLSFFAGLHFSFTNASLIGTFSLSSHDSLFFSVYSMPPHTLEITGCSSYSEGVTWAFVRKRGERERERITRFRITGLTRKLARTSCGISIFVYFFSSPSLSFPTNACVYLECRSLFNHRTSLYTMFRLKSSVVADGAINDKNF